MRITALSSFFIIVCLGVLPSMMKASLGASSLALGLVLSLILVLIYYVKNLTALQKIPRLILIFILVMVVHSAILQAQLIFLNSRAYISFILLLFVLSMAFFLSKIILIKKFNISESANYTFIMLILLAFIAYITDFKLGQLFYGHNKAIFPFGEPSHFALFFGPFFLLYLFQLPSIFKQLIVVFAVAVLAAHVESTTLLIYVALALFVFFRLSLIAIYFIVPISIYGAYFVLNDPYFLSRLILSPDSVNLTALVYLQGLTDAYNALIATNGFGLGFQMLGTQPPSEIFYQIQSVMGHGPDGVGLNRTDGGFLAAKLTAEFGVVGLILLLSYLILFFKVFLKLRELIRLPNNIEPAYIFSLVFIYAAFVEIFVRGVGYFSPSLFLFFTALFVFNTCKKRVRYLAPHYC